MCKLPGLASADRLEEAKGLAEGVEFSQRIVLTSFAMWQTSSVGSSIGPVAGLAAVGVLEGPEASVVSDKRNKSSTPWLVN